MLKMMPAFALGSTLLISGVATAQQNEPNETRTETRREERVEERQQRGEVREDRRADRGERREGQDEMFAQCLAIDNAVEVQISEFAAQRLQNDQVKQFAQQMVQEHRKMIEKLGNYGAEPVNFSATATRDAANATPANADVTVRTGREGAEVAVDGNNQPAGRREAGANVRERVNDRREARQGDFLSIKQEIAQECLRSAEEELTSKTGPEADKCFMAAQVMGHQHMLDTLKVFERHASAEFKQTLAQASQETQKHLDEAKQILKSLDSQATNDTPAANSGSTR
jgi:predicted outer membrane protein